MIRSNDKNKSRRFDLILISTLLIISIIAVCVTLLTREEGAVAVIKIDGVTVMECPLDKNSEYLLNGGTNKLVIQDGEAYMSEAHCPTKSCMGVGKIKYKGQSIVCSPNKITVFITGGKDNTGVDFVS